MQEKQIRLSRDEVITILDRFKLESQKQKGDDPLLPLYPKRLNTRRARELAALAGKMEGDIRNMFWDHTAERYELWAEKKENRLRVFVRIYRPAPEFLRKLGKRGLVTFDYTVGERTAGG
jgi:hypothetical protein